MQTADFGVVSLSEALLRRAGFDPSAGDIRALVACERSGVIRDELLALGVNAISCDLHPSDRPGPHFQGDALEILPWGGWDLLIAHPVCRFLANSGVRWLKTDASRWPEMFEGARFFRAFDRAEHIPYRIVENPVMHRYALELVGRGADQFFQPWHHGDQAFKLTGLWLTNLKRIVETDRLVPPKAGTDEHRRWSRVHRCPPGEERERQRSETYPGVGRAIAQQSVGQIRAARLGLAA